MAEKKVKDISNDEANLVCSFVLSLSLLWQQKTQAQFKLNTQSSTSLAANASQRQINSQSTIAIALSIILI